MQASGTEGESDRVEAEIPEPFLSELVQNVKDICTALLPALRK
jgi:hypothetical protein